MAQVYYFMTELSQNWFFTGYLLVFFAFGIGLIAYGLALRSFPTLGSWRSVTQRQLRSWGFLADEEGAEQILRDLLQCWRRIQPPMPVVAGCGVLFVTLFEAYVYVYSADSLLRGVLLSSWGFLTLFDLGLLFGLVGGHLLGAVQWRNAGAHRIMYGDLRNRRLIDYRSPLFFWLSMALIAGVFVVTLIAAPDTSKHATLYTLDGEPVNISLSRPLLFVVPGTMLFTLALGELLMRSLAARSRLLLTENPTVAQRLDDMLRGLIIGATQGITLVALGGEGSGQWNLLDHAIQVASPRSTYTNSAYFWLAALFATSTIVCSLIGFLLIGCNGRIGGRLSGWPWRPPRADSQAA